MKDFHKEAEWMVQKTDWRLVCVENGRHMPDPVVIPFLLLEAKRHNALFNSGSTECFVFVGLQKQLITLKRRKQED